MENIQKETLEYFNGDELAASVWISKYAADGEKTPNDMHKRLAKEFNRIESNYINKEKFLQDKKNNLSEYGKKRDDLTEENIFNLFKDFKYIVPQGRVMAGLGITESYRSLSNCLRLPSPKDNYSSIMYTDTMLVSSAKRGCGYGVGISNLRPEETQVSNAAKTSTGAVSFMSRYSNSTREVGQNSRRGACLLDIDINHPDVLKFINIKHDLTKITGANISVFLNDEFMKAVENDEDYFLTFPVSERDFFVPNIDMEYNILYKSIRGAKFVKRIKAKEYFNEIILSAKNFAEPGVFFRNRFNTYSPSNVYKKYFEEGTNACGEQPMAVFDTCRLILNNLFSIVKNPFAEEAEIDYELLYKIVYEQLRLGDDLCDLEIEYLTRIIDKINSDDEPIEEKQIELTLWENVRDMAKSGRRVGCGITGLADMLAALNLKYDSEEALKIVEQVMKIKMKAELDCTIDLSILRGEFNGYDKNKEFSITEDGNLEKGQNDWYDFILKEFPDQTERMVKYGRRNVNFNTIAPAGSVSILTQTSSGCEPVFSPYYMRRKKINPSDKNNRIDFTDQNGDIWQEYPILHPKFKYWVKMQNENLTVETLNKNDLDLWYQKSPWYKSTANDIDWNKRIKMQSILQKYITSAISSTLNLPSTTTKETVNNIYLEAWKLGLKGVTIYVNGSRDGVMVAPDKDTKTICIDNSATKRPKSIKGKVVRFNNNNGEKWVSVVGLLNNKPYEIFTGLLDKLNIPSYVEEGNIIKVKEPKIELDDNGNEFQKLVGRYDFQYKNKEGVLVTIDGLSRTFREEYWNYAKLISGLLRHNMPIEYVVKMISDLNLGNSNINSWKNGVIRTLKKFIKDGTDVGEKCPECGGKLVRSSGCISCPDCGWSKCS